MTTLFSQLRPSRRGVVEMPLAALIPNAPRDDIAPEWFLWFINQLAAERPSVLLFAIGDGPAYIQLAVGHRGHVLAEVSSNLVLPAGARLQPAQVLALTELGWEDPTCGWPEPLEHRGFRSPNHWRRWEPPVFTGVIAVLLLRTLEEVLGAARLNDLWITFFRETVGRAGPHPHPHPEVADPLVECFEPEARLAHWRAARADRDLEYLRWAVRAQNEAHGWFYPKEWDTDG